MLGGFGVCGGGGRSGLGKKRGRLGVRDGENGGRGGPDHWWDRGWREFDWVGGGQSVGKGSKKKEVEDPAANRKKEKKKKQRGFPHRGGRGGKKKRTAGGWRTNGEGEVEGEVFLGGKKGAVEEGKMGWDFYLLRG